MSVGSVVGGGGEEGGNETGQGRAVVGGLFLPGDQLGAESDRPPHVGREIGSGTKETAEPGPDGGTQYPEGDQPIPDLVGQAGRE